MQTAGDILGRANIHVRVIRHGNTKTLCPECSHKRKHKKDPCLSITIDDTGVRYFCHNCQFRGGEFYDQDRFLNDQPKHPHLNPRAAERAVRKHYR